MSKLSQLRGNLHLTQEELAQRSGLSVRTLQRIESGIPPKGHTLKALAGALGVAEEELIGDGREEEAINSSLIKLINFSSLPFCVFPPANIIVPLLIMAAKKQFDPLSKQIVSVQILWSIAAVVIFMLAAFTKNWMDLRNEFTLIVMILLVLSNLFIILRNTVELDKHNRLYIRFSFSII